ncbi:ferredoxin reductase [Actinocorallia longicatena]|uniref:Ferredoxin reductase n=1 Tax=Actinocorallia longicatena TaxID=111803 RepID=A0ABP6QGL0_9ACTN
MVRRLAWLPAELVGRRTETASAVTLDFDVPGWPGHLAGQHVDIRLTAEDGYSTQRSYSLAEPGRVALTVQRVTGGEVSPYLADVLRIGDTIELRGPVGGYFVWRPSETRPVLLVGGGSGVVPLAAMIRARTTGVPFRLVYSVRSPEELLYASELRRPPGGVDVTTIYTRRAPEGSPRAPGRLTPADLAAHGWPADFEPDCFVCGPTGFVEAVTGMLIALGHDPSRIRTERFGPSGD